MFIVLSASENVFEAFHVEGERETQGLVERRVLRGGHHVVLGHSDADVALHALADAILGALAMRDIGYHFPDTDPRWKGADSRMLLREVAAMAAAQGYRPSNVDITVMAQEPRLLPHIPAMQACVAADLGLEPGRVSIKATTTERLGFTGRAEGIAAQATALLIRAD